MYSSSCGTINCSVQGYKFTTPVLATYYQVLDTNRAPINLAGIGIGEFNSNYTCSAACNTLMPADGSWITNIYGVMTNPDGIAQCSLACYQGGTCNTSWDQSFSVYLNSNGYSVSIINGLLTGSYNVNSTSCGTCPTSVPTS